MRLSGHRRLPRTVAVLAALFVAAPAVQSGGQAAGTGSEAQVVSAFEARVREYVELHRRIEGPLPPMQVSRDMNTVQAAMDALSRRIRAARQAARQGDLFTPDAARVLRRRISASLTLAEVDDILADGQPDEPVALPRPVPNAPWPERVPFIFVPPRLIAVLPPLPPELQYRIIGSALVIWDHHANLIVDVLPSAFTNS